MGQAIGMDELDDIRIIVVKAMTHLENAVSVGLPAQAPQSGRDEIAAGLEAFKMEIEEALNLVKLAEATLRRIS